MKRKLKNTRGETLVEVLASILIGALSVALLFTAVMASARMDRIAQETDKTYNAALTAAEKQETAVDTAIVPPGTTVTVTKDGDATGKDISVTFYGGDGALSYKLP